MKKIISTYKHLLLLLILLSGGVYSYAQNCKDYEKKCSDAPKGFKSSSMSRSFSMKKQRKVNINQTFYGGRQYYMAVCGKPKLGKIHFRIIEDDENKTVLYDNAADGFTISKMFAFESTIKLIIEISAPNYFTDSESECAGIVLAYKTIE